MKYAWCVSRDTGTRRVTKLHPGKPSEVFVGDEALAYLARQCRCGDNAVPDELPEVHREGQRTLRPDSPIVVQLRRRSHTSRATGHIISLYTNGTARLRLDSRLFVTVPIDDYLKARNSG